MESSQSWRPGPATIRGGVIQVNIFRSMRGKILLVLVIVGLLPLILASWLFYHSARDIIVGDRVEIYLKHLSQQTADKLDLFLIERIEEGEAMSSNETIERFLARPDGVPDPEILGIINEYVQIHEVYDLMVLVDRTGTVRAVNTLNRFGDWLDNRLVASIVNGRISSYPEEAAVWQSCLSGKPAAHDWYSSGLVKALYYFEDDDISRTHHLAFAQPIKDHQTGEVAGVWLNILNWEYVQAMLDLIETDFKRYNLPSGRAYLLSRDSFRILAAPQRQGRGSPATENLIGRDIRREARFGELYGALRQGGATIRYRLEEERHGGVSRVGTPGFPWLVMISLSEEDIFQPVYRLGLVFLAIILAAMTLILASSWIASRTLIRPLVNLKESTLDIARGCYDRQVEAHGEDEIGVLARSFNQMSQTIRQRQQELEDIIRQLEEKVLVRTRDLETSNQELREALQHLKDAQDQLIQTEKLASLGRLVAGIAHEIKNPLNFIYGNTRFLDEYIEKVRKFVTLAEAAAAADETVLETLRRHRAATSLDFVLDDLGHIAANIHEGALRIRNIVDDLRTFARTPTGGFEDVDMGKVLDMCLNLLRNQYKHHIRIHRDYENVPAIQASLGKMEQVFLNILTNAIDAVEGEGDVWIRLRSLVETVVVEVEDSGPGIPPEHVPKLFDPFFTTKEVGKGTGLGLSISYNIVKQHQGRITAGRGKGGGALIRVELPICPSPPQEEATDGA